MASVDDIVVAAEISHAENRHQAIPYPNFTLAMARLMSANGTEGESDHPWPPDAGQWDPALGPRAQIVLISLYSLTTLLAVLGNLLVLAVLTLGKHLKTELKAFLVNLALADLAMAGFCMPFTFTQVMLGRWIFGAAMCPLVLFMQVLSVAVSIFTNMAIGIDRYWGVIFPLRTRLTKSRTKWVLFFIWVAAAGLAGIQLNVARLKQQHVFVGGATSCNERWPSPLARHVYTVTVAAITYVIPLAILAFTYYKVAAKLWDRRTPGNAHHIRDEIMVRSKRKVLKMVVTLVAVFAVCWLPLQLFNLLIDFAPQLLDAILSHEDEQIYYGVYYTCHWVAMANSFTNPIIYGLLNDNFRLDMRLLFCPCIPGDVSSPEPVTRRSFMRKSFNNSPRICVSRTHSNGKATLLARQGGHQRLSSSYSELTPSPNPALVAMLKGSPKRFRFDTQEIRMVPLGRSKKDTPCDDSKGFAPSSAGYVDILGSNNDKDSPHPELSGEEDAVFCD